MYQMLLFCSSEKKAPYKSGHSLFPFSTAVINPLSPYLIFVKRAAPQKFYNSIYILRAILHWRSG